MQLLGKYRPLVNGLFSLLEYPSQEGSAVTGLCHVSHSLGHWEVTLPPQAATDLS